MCWVVVLLNFENLLDRWFTSIFSLSVGSLTLLIVFHAHQVLILKKLSFSLLPALLVCNMCASSLSRVWLFTTLCTEAHQAPLSMGILQTRILKWIARLFSRGSSQPRDRTQVSHIAGGFFTVWARGAYDDEVNVSNHWDNQKVRNCHWNNHTVPTSRVPGVHDWTQFLSSVSVSIKCKW